MAIVNVFVIIQSANKTSMVIGKLKMQLQIAFLQAVFGLHFMALTLSF